MESSRWFTLFSSRFDYFGIFALSIAGCAVILSLLLVLLITKRSANTVWRVAQTLITMAREDARRSETLGPSRRAPKTRMMHSGRVAVMATITEDPEEDPTEQTRARGTLADSGKVDASDNLENP